MRKSTITMQLILAISLAACTIARDRHYPSNIFSSEAMGIEAAQDAVADDLKTGTLYTDLALVLEVHALYQNLRLRKAFVASIADAYGYSEQAATELSAEQFAEYNQQVGFIVVVIGEGNKQLKLRQDRGEWTALWRDDDGQLQYPLSIRRLGSNDDYYMFLERYFPYDLHWGEVYEVVFHKLSKEVIGAEIGDFPPQLIVSGLLGKVVLEWDDAQQFYEKSEAGAEQSININ